MITYSHWRDTNNVCTMTIQLLQIPDGSKPARAGLPGPVHWLAGGLSRPGPGVFKFGNQCCPECTGAACTLACFVPAQGACIGHYMLARGRCKAASDGGDGGGRPFNLRVTWRFSIPFRLFYGSAWP